MALGSIRSGFRHCSASRDGSRSAGDRSSSCTGCGRACCDSACGDRACRDCVGSDRTRFDYTRRDRTRCDYRTRCDHSARRDYSARRIGASCSRRSLERGDEQRTDERLASTDRWIAVRIRDRDGGGIISSNGRTPERGEFSERSVGRHPSTRFGREDACRTGDRQSDLLDRPIAAKRAPMRKRWLLRSMHWGST